MMKLALLIAGVFCCHLPELYISSTGFTQRMPRQKNEAVSSAEYEYENIIRELEAIRRRQENTPPPQNVSNNSPSDYAALVERVMHPMVFIRTNISSGSGFFVSQNGDIVANNHVIKDAEYIVVTTQGGQNVSALVKDYDAQRDIALLKVNMSYALPFLN